MPSHPTPHPPQRRKLVAAMLALAALSLASCVGVDATASIARDGSGTLQLHYTISKMAVSFGALEANAKLLPFPVSREDFDRTVSGIDGLSLSSYSQKEEAEDLIVDATLAFTTTKSLAAFLDPKGERASFLEEGGKRRLDLVMAGGVAALDPELKKIVDVAFERYSISLVLRLPTPVTSPGTGKASSDGLKVDWSSPVVALIESPSKVVWTVTW